MTANSDTTNIELVSVSPAKHNAILRWKRVTNPSGPQPRPRHGHRSVNIKELMVVFGGGNEGIVDELHVYNTATNQWYVPATKGDVPPGCAAYGFVVDGTRILVFGGMVEYGKYSNELYELQATKWEWKKLRPKPPESGPPPCRRLGHSFTLVGDKVYLFGGLANESDDPKNNIPKYLNDLYILEIKNNQLQWEIPTTFGESPPPRESHTAVSWYDKKLKKYWLVIYGGMSGCRLGDLWLLDTDTMSWTRPRTSGPLPLPRSLHSSTLIGHRMYVFGGWVPLMMDDVKVEKHEKEWKCTNTLASLNLETMTWEELDLDTEEENMPRARAGHCAVGIHTRLYIWSGRDGYRKAWNNQVRVCCKDLWYLEVERPAAASRVQLVRASTHSLEVCWPVVPSASCYILEVQKISHVPPPSPASVTQSSVTPVAFASTAISAAISSPVASAGPVSPAQMNNNIGVSSGEPQLQQPFIKQLPSRIAGAPTTIAVSAASIQSPILHSPVVVQPVVANSNLNQASIGIQSATNNSVGIVSSPLHTVTTPVQRIVTKVHPAKQIQTTQKVLTTNSPILQQQATQMIAKQQPPSQALQAAVAQATLVTSTSQQLAQLQHQAQTIRVVATGGTAISNAQQLTTGTGTPIRVLSSTGQQLRIGTAGTTTIQQGQTAVLRATGQNIVTSAQLQAVQQRIVSATSGSTTTTATIGGKQIILQKPVTIVSGTAGAGGPATGSMNSATTNQGQILTLVKTSQGMTMQTVPKMSMVQKSAGSVGGTLHTSQQQIITSNLITGGGGTVMQQGAVTGPTGVQKTTVIGGNVVKLMSAGTGTIGSKQILMKNPNIVQVGKVGTNATGKPTLVLTNKAGQPLRGNQQVIVVTTPQGIRTVSGTVTSSASNFVTLSTSQVINTISTSRATNIGGATVLQANSVSGASTPTSLGGSAISVASSGTTTTTLGGQAIKLRAVQGGKPITFTMPVGGLQAAGQKLSGTQIINMPQKLVSSGKAVTVQLTPSTGGPKTVTLVPSGTAGTVGTGATVTGQSGGQKILMLPTKTTTRIVTQQQYQQIQLQQQQLQVAQQQQQLQQQQQHEQQVSTDAAFAALAAETGMMETDGDGMEQMDGCFDFEASLEEDNEFMMEKKEGHVKVLRDDLDEESKEGDTLIVSDTFSKMPIFEQLDGCDDTISSESDQKVEACFGSNPPVVATAKVRYVKVGLYGGAVNIAGANNDGSGSSDDNNASITYNQTSDNIEDASVGDDVGDEQQQASQEARVDSGGEIGTTTRENEDVGAGDEQEEGSTDSHQCEGNLTANINDMSMENTKILVSTGEDELHSGEKTEDKSAVAIQHLQSEEDPAVLEMDEIGGVKVAHAEHSSSANTSIVAGTMEDDTHQDLGALLDGQAVSDTIQEQQQEMSFGEQNETDALPQQRLELTAVDNDGEAIDHDTLVSQVPVRNPTASETEAANILTTIKSADILSIQNTELLASGDTGEGGIVCSNENMIQLRSSIAGRPPPDGENVQTITLKTESVEATSDGTVVTLSDGTTTFLSRLQHLGDPSHMLPTMVKTEDNNAFTTGHLDALAEAAASATSAFPAELMNNASSTGALISDLLSSPTPYVAQQQQQHTTSIKFHDGGSKQFSLASPLLQSNSPIATVNNGNNVIPANKPIITTNAIIAVGNVGKSGVGGAAAIKSKDELEELKPIKPKDASEIWHTVGIFKAVNSTVSNYIDASEWDSTIDGEMLSADNIPNLSDMKRINLEPGCAYRFRVAAINSCGRGDWSDVTPFKTCLPGFPGAPSAIKISKSPEGAHLSWEPPPSTTGDILEYSVYLAVKSQTPTKDKAPSTNGAQLAFVRVYCGSNNQCTVPNQSLQSAHVDYTSKPAIIFRIAARNDKGYGPATQVRWLQDPQSSKSGPAAGGAVGQTQPVTGAKRLTDKSIGGSANKRAKVMSSNAAMMMSPQHNH